MISRRLLLVSLILGVVSLLRAESPAPVERSAPDPHPAAPARLPADRLHSVVFAAIDLDRNGVLSSAEIASAPTVLRALDLNDDGMLTTDELRRVELRPRSVAAEMKPTREARPGRLSPGFILAFALDANHDGVIQTMEMANAATSLRTLDANGDDQLTPNELHPVYVVAQNDR